MDAEAKLEGGRIVVRVLDEGPYAKVQMSLVNDDEQEDTNPRILELGEITEDVFRGDQSLRAEIQDNRVRMYREMPGEEQDIASLTPRQVLRIAGRIEDRKPTEIQRAMMFYREPISGIPKMAIELSICLHDTKEDGWSGMEPKMMIVGGGNTREEAVEDIVMRCRKELDCLRRDGRLEEWATRKEVQVIQLDPPTRETGFQSIILD